MLFRVKFFIAWVIILSGCYGTFRTAQSVPKNKWNIQIAWTILETEYKVWKYSDSPYICIRRGHSERSDVGLKLYISGFEVLMYYTVLKERGILSSIGMEAGIGYPVLYDLHIILSKKFCFFNSYFAYKVVGFPAPFVYGLNVGISFNFYKRINLYLEYFYGQIFIPSPPAFDAPPPRKYKGNGLGLSLSFTF